MGYGIAQFRADRMLKARALVADNSNRHLAERLPAHVARQATCREIRIVNACTRTMRRHHRTVYKWISSQHRSPGVPIRLQQSAAVTEALGCQECLRFRGILLHTGDSAKIYSSFVGPQKEWAPDSTQRPSRRPGNTEAALTDLQCQSLRILGRGTLKIRILVNFDASKTSGS